MPDKLQHFIAILNKNSTGLMLFVTSALLLSLSRIKASRFKSISRSTSLKSNKSNDVNIKSNTLVSKAKTPTSIIQDFWEGKDHNNEFLKDILGERSMEWTKTMNKHCVESLGNPVGSTLYNKILSILDSKDKIPHVHKIKSHFYNFWKDGSNPRGILRRTTLDSYRSINPNWEKVLDVDQLGKVENESWVYEGFSVFHPPFGKEDSSPNRILLKLSRGGTDATVVREFDLDSCSFIDEAHGGFIIPEAKNRVSWKSIDCLLVGTDLKDGKSMTDSGYPRVVREWKRGTLLTDATIVFEGLESDVSVSNYMAIHGQHRFEMRHRSLTFYKSANAVLIHVDSSTSVWCDILVQDDAEVDVFADQLIISTRSEWTITKNNVSKTYKQGSLLSTDLKSFALHGPSQAEISILFEPSNTVSLESYTATKDYIIISKLDNVKNRLAFWKYVVDNEKSSNNATIGQWIFCGNERDAVIRGAYLSAVDSDHSNLYWLTTNTFVQPFKLFLADAEQGPEGIQSAELMKSLPDQFESNGLVEQQFEAESADGTRIPYFIIGHKNMPLDGTTPTLLYGYGGFEVSMTPVYSGVIGASWLDHKVNGHYTCYVMANIRGGGEFGPKWHQAALRENRNKAYEDFIAIAEDLIKRKITNPSRLGIRGGSNGGLLMGNMIVSRPDLFGA
eukprot:gene9903-13323_t